MRADGRTGRGTGTEPEANAERQSHEAGFTLDDFKSDDEAMRTCLELARVAARTELPLLILGETGTGKTILAHALHNSSARAHRPFAAFNAAALSDTLIDSQLFGHERGAFTGADRRLKGKFEQADGGTLFIDEIADMSLSAQAKILRAVEYGEFERLGSEQLLHADVRLISATHHPITRFLEDDQFRRDLFYRVSGITLRLPSLRQRPNDLRSLIVSEVESACQAQAKDITTVSAAALGRLLDHPWPGNLRELKRVIQTAVALSETPTIEPAAIILEDLELPRARQAHANRGQDRPDDDLSLRTAELRHIESVLRRMGGNKRQAAKALGLSRSTLDRKLAEDHGAD